MKRALCAEDESAKPGSTDGDGADGVYRVGSIVDLVKLAKRGNTVFPREWMWLSGGACQYFAILCGQLLGARRAGKIKEEEFEGTIDVLKKAYYEVLPCNRVFPERGLWIGFAER